ncbi:MAG: Cof-type HAD-IIB family hydrolase [Treponema sp.]|nr:Cof-type HAD-IIB family hydrolase [Treponema sp.]
METSAGSVQLIAFDLDGTLLNSKKEISPRTRKALEAARAAGIFTIPITGRQYDDIHREVKELAHPWVIANNGAQILSAPEGELLFSRTLEGDTALALLETARDLKALIFGACGAGGIFDHRGRGFEEGVTRRILRRREFLSGEDWMAGYPLDDLAELIRTEKQNFIKFVLLFEDPGERQRAFDLFLPRKDLYVTFFDQDNMEILPAGINKGTALAAAAERLGVPLSRVMALGDSDNDREMIRAAGIGVAMGNALDSVKREADRITLSCDEDGAAAAIESALPSASA